MNREELYYQTVDLLLDAYNSGKLEHGTCEACAVGNICQKAANHYGFGRGIWGSTFLTVLNDEVTAMKQSRHNISLAQTTLLSEFIGYSIDELAQIEYTFESAVVKDWKSDGFRNAGKAYEHYVEKYPKQGQFIGLTAVLKILREIHEMDAPISQTSQQRLEKIASEKFGVAV